MPFVRIDLREGQPASFVRAISDAIHRALGEHFNVPARDRFQIINEHKPEHLIYDPHYLDIDRTDAIVFIQIFLREGRTDEQKKAFYARVAELLQENPGMSPQDVFITLFENTSADWTFGNGRAQMLEMPREQWK
jgi:4-oxalocrotonate tautomerase